MKLPKPGDLRLTSTPPLDGAADVLSGNIPQKIRPKKGRAWAEEIEAELNEEGIDGSTVRRKLVRKVRQLAEAGVPWAIQFLAEREDGRPHQAVALEGGDGEPLSLTIVSYRDSQNVSPAGGEIA